jgi:AMP phosphorylase
VLLKVKRLYIEAGGKPIVLLNKEDADDIGVRALGRVKIVNAEGREITSVVNVTYRAVEKGIIGAYDEVASKLKL